MSQSDPSRETHLHGVHKDSVAHATATMQQSLRRIVGDVRSGSDGIAAGVTQTAMGNAELSQRTQQQASSLEEAAASTAESIGVIDGIAFPNNILALNGRGRGGASRRAGSRLCRGCQRGACDGAVHRQRARSRR